MAAITYGMTDRGFVRKPLSAIIDSLNSRFTAEFGSTFDVSPEGPDGQVIGIVANEASLLWEQAQNAFNSYRPGSMEGVGLDNICELTGTTRYIKRPTQVTVQCGGDAGTVVPAGAIVGDDLGRQFVTANDVTLPGDVTAICQTIGELYVAAGTVTKIITTGIDGWTSVTNPEDGMTGVNYESDPKLRARRDKTTVNTGTATAEAIYSSLASLNLDYIRIRDNDTDSAIGNQPPNSIYVVVDGGTINDIARKIYDNKTGGIPTYGNIKTAVKDSKGHPHDIYFSRTTKIPVFFKIKVKRISTVNLSSNDVKVLVQGAVQSYINSLQPGAAVAWSYVIPAILAAAKGIQIDTLEVGLSADTVGTQTLPMDIDQRAHVEIADIDVEDTTLTG